MATTQKRITLALTKEDLRQLAFLCHTYGENQSQVIKRAIQSLYECDLKEIKYIEDKK